MPLPSNLPIGHTGELFIPKDTLVDTNNLREHITFLFENRARHLGMELNVHIETSPDGYLCKWRPANG